MAGDVAVKGPARLHQAMCQLVSESGTARNQSRSIQERGRHRRRFECDASLVVTALWSWRRRPAGGHYRGTSAGGQVHRRFFARANRFAHSFAPAHSTSPTTTVLERPQALGSASRCLLHVRRDRRVASISNCPGIALCRPCKSNWVNLAVPWLRVFARERALQPSSERRHGAGPLPLFPVGLLCGFWQRSF